MPTEPYLEHHPRVDPSAFVHSSAVLIGEVSVGPGATVWPCVSLRGDDGGIEIGENSNVQDGSSVHCTEDLSTTRVGRCVTVGHNVTLHGATVEDHCIIGMGSIVMDNAVIGHHSIVGAGALVTSNKVFPPHSLILGSPAKRVRALNDKELEWIEYSWQRYVEQGRIYRARRASEQA